MSRTKSPLLSVFSLISSMLEISAFGSKIPAADVFKIVSTTMSVPISNSIWKQKKNICFTHRNLGVCLYCFHDNYFLNFTLCYVRHKQKQNKVESLFTLFAIFSWLSNLHENKQKNVALSITLIKNHFLKVYVITFLFLLVVFFSSSVFFNVHTKFTKIFSFCFKNSLNFFSSLSVDLQSLERID